MLVEQVDVVRLQPRERLVDDGPDVRRLAVQPRQLAVLDVEPELGAEHDVLPHRRQGLAHHAFIRAGSVGFGRVEEGDAHVHGLADQGDGHLSLGNEAAVVAHAHAAQAERRYLEAVLAGSHSGAGAVPRRGRLAARAGRRGR